MSGKVREGLHSGCWRAETLFSMRWQSVLREFPERPRRRPKWTRKLKGVVSVNWRDYVGDDWYQEGTDPSELSSVPRAMRQGRAGRQEERVGRTNMDVQREGPRQGRADGHHALGNEQQRNLDAMGRDDDCSAEVLLGDSTPAQQPTPHSTTTCNSSSGLTQIPLKLPSLQTIFVFASFRVARSTLQKRKCWWMSRPTVMRVTFDLPESEEPLKNQRRK